MKICKQCNIEYEDNMKFCPECGTKLEDVRKTCPNCGSEYKEGQKFCSECGTNLTDMESASPYVLTQQIEDLYKMGVKYYNDADFENENIQTEPNLIKAFDCFMKAAQYGNANAYDYLAICYEEGYGTALNKDKSCEMYQKAITLFEKLAERGDEEAIIKLSDYYLRGNGVRKNIAKSMELLDSAYKDGYIKAGLELASRYKYGILGCEKNEVKAFELYTELANNGDADAQYWMGHCYDYGEGVEEDKETAIHWYQKAARGGNSSACFSLGLEEDNSEALNWFKKSYERKNDDFVAYKIGECYRLGYDGERDIEKAVEWYLKSNGKVREAAFQLGEYYMEKKDYLNAYSWYKKARDIDEKEYCDYPILHTKAKDRLSKYFNIDGTVKESMSEARDADINYLRAQEYYYGDGVDQNMQEAFRLYKIAANLGHIDAAYELAEMYKDEEEDQEEALKWYTRAADLGHIDATCKLAEMYFYGDGVDYADKDEAHRLYKKASENEEAEEDQLKEIGDILLIKESRILSPIQIGIIASVLRSNELN